MKCQVCWTYDGHHEDCELNNLQVENKRLRANIKAIEKNTDYWADEARRLREENNNLKFVLAEKTMEGDGD